MLGNDSMETASTALTSIRRRNGIVKSTWRTHRYFVDFESQIHVEISTSNRWRIDEDVSIGRVQVLKKNYIFDKYFEFLVAILFTSTLQNQYFDI